MTDLDVQIVPQQSELLGRQKVHDERSRAFSFPAAVDRSTWRDKAIRIYDPLPNPNQPVGCCTHVAKCVQFNAVGNRRTGVVLDMHDALIGYAHNTTIDPWDGTFVYNPETRTWGGEDTGSSGLASAKTAQKFGDGGEYRWLFGGADEVVQAVMGGAVVSVGTWWYADMFGASGGTVSGGSTGPAGDVPIVTPTGGVAGGHQYAIRGYDASSDLVLGRCWWGPFKDFWIARSDLDSLLRDGGDAHVQTRA